jgi:hypothetical protein
MRRMKLLFFDSFNDILFLNIGKIEIDTQYLTITFPE